MSARLPSGRHQIHPGTKEWPTAPLPGVSQLVIRGSETDWVEARNQVLYAENLADAFLSEFRTTGTIDWNRNWEPRIGKQIAAKLGKQSLQLTFPPECWSLFPDLKRFYLWDVILEGAEELPVLPAGLEVLELNGVQGLGRIPALPKGLRTLVVQGCGAAVWPPEGADQLRQLEELCVHEVETLTQDWLDAVLTASTSTLRKLDLSSCVRIGRVRAWPAGLVDVRLNRCTGLRDLPESWPLRLRRLELRGSAALDRLADFTEDAREIDFLDLGGMSALTRLPALPRWPRTLRIYDSGLELPPELHGVDADENVSRAVAGYLEEAKRGLARNDEMKLILLGNGRCGKTSLARRVTGQGSFQAREKSTHGIHFWSYEETFQPLREEGTATARVNVWDFAGQDLYHSTHRLFLQSKAAFLLCETRAGDGADAASDGTADDPHFHADVKRPMSYWRQQVDSLGHAPGRKALAPRRIVETKINRPPRPDAPAEVEGVEIRTSAETGDGIEEALRPGVRDMIAEALGRPGERLWPVAALAVRAELQRLKDANQAAEREADATGRHVTPPHGAISRTEFDALVRQHAVPGGAYHADPGLVLTLLHRSGFLFASPRMPDRVILDQRWAVQGIYTLFDREEGCWRKLEGAGGKFTLGDLREWIWKKKGYAETEQADFLEMMLACGICFQLLPEWLTPDGQAIYVAPAALPEEDWFRRRVEADRAGLSEIEWKPVANVAEEDWRAIQVKLGEIWGRTAVLWRTGGQVKAFYRPGEAPPGGDSFMALEWHRDPDAFAGEVRLRGFGGDQAFFAEVEKLCRSFEGASAESPAKGKAEPAEMGEVRQPAGQPTAEQRNAPKVAISFAGWEDRNAPQEQVAMELCRTLQGRVTVEHYRMEQARPETEKQGKPQRYLEHLLASDFVVVLLTEKYVRSPWCLYEAMRLWERLIDGEYNAGMMRAFAFPEVYCSPGDDAKWVRLSGELDACWSGHAAEFNEALRDLGFLEAERKAAESDLKPWYAFAAVGKNREDLAGKVLKGWLPKPVPDGMPSSSFFEQHAESILQSMADPAPIFALAKKAWNQNQPDRAAAAYREALRRRDGAEWRAGLDRPEADPDLEGIRRWIMKPV